MGRNSHNAAKHDAARMAHQRAAQQSNAWQRSQANPYTQRKIPMTAPASHLPQPAPFNPAEFVREAQRAGVTLRVDHGDKLVAAPAGMLPERLRTLAKVHKVAIVAHLDSAEFLA